VNTKVFISHAGSEAREAGEVAALLRQAGLQPLLDTERTRLGESFIRNGRETLDPAKSLAAQNIAPKSLLWLQVEIVPFAAGENVGYGPGSATFRGGRERVDVNPNAALLQWARQLGLDY
jgi:hypothetical protein